MLNQKYFLHLLNYISDFEAVNVLKKQLFWNEYLELIVPVLILI